MSDYRELLLGCGRNATKQYMAHPTHTRGWRNPNGPVRLDINIDVRPDLWCDLNGHPPWYAFPRDEPQEHPYSAGFELEKDYWDEVHAYQVLEHLGSQGNATTFFGHFQEIWRILKPDGYLVAACPSRSSPWLWGDPSHRRAIVPESLVFLDQSEYVKQCDGPHPTPMSDFRSLYTADFRLVDMTDNRADFVFVLQAVKPSRWVAPAVGKEPPHV